MDDKDKLEKDLTLFIEKTGEGEKSTLRASLLQSVALILFLLCFLSVAYPLWTDSPTMWDVTAFLAGLAAALESLRAALTIEVVRLQNRLSASLLSALDEQIVINKSLKKPS